MGSLMLWSLGVILMVLAVVWVVRSTLEFNRLLPLAMQLSIEVGKRPNLSTIHQLYRKRYEGYEESLRSLSSLPKWWGLVSPFDLRELDTTYERLGKLWKYLYQDQSREAFAGLYECAVQRLEEIQDCPGVFEPQIAQALVLLALVKEAVAGLSPDWLLVHSIVEAVDFELDNPAGKNGLIMGEYIDQLGLVKEVTPASQ